MRSPTVKAVAAADLALVATIAHAQVVEAGKAAFRKCVACHAAGASARPRAISQAEGIALLPPGVDRVGPGMRVVSEAI